jgi:hypothetical protein
MATGRRRESTLSDVAVRHTGGGKSVSILSLTRLQLSHHSMVKN